MGWPLAGWQRKTDMRRRAKRFPLFLKAVVMLTKLQMTAPQRILEFKNLLKNEQHLPLQERLRMPQREIR